MNIFDAHISGSMSVSGSAEISGDLTVLGTLNATVSGTTTNAVSASHAAAYTLTSSFEAFTGSYTTGSFTGSFAGDGGKLFNIPASGVTGLNLSQISDGSATASISQADGLRVNTNSEFTGSVKITGSIYLNGNPIGTGKLDETTFNSYTSSNDSRVSSIETSTGSLNSFTSSTNTRLGLIETSTGSLNAFSSSTNTKLGLLDAASGSIRADFNSYTSSNDGRVSALETSSGSLNSFTSSINTTIKNKLNTEGVISGSGQVNISETTGYSTFSSSIATNDLGQNSRLSSLETASASLNSYTSSNTTNINAIHTATASLNSFSASVLGAIEATGSNLTVKGNLLVKGTTTQIDSTTLNIGDNIIQLNGAATNNAGIVVQDASGASIVSGSLLWDTATDYWKAGKLGSEERIILNNEYNTFSTSIDGRATSLETSRTSLNSYTSSNDNRLNTIEGTTGSLNSYTSSNNTRLGIIEGTTGSLNTFTSSASGRLTSLESASSSIRSDFNSYTSSANGRLSSVETSTGSLNSYTSSNNTRLGIIEGTTGSLNTFTSSATSRLGSLETASGSIRSDFNSYTSSNNSRSTAIESTTSSLNSYTSSNTTNINAIQTSTASLNTFSSSANTRLGLIETSTGSLNSFTNSINTTIKSKLDSDGVISGSIQVNLTGTTGYSTFSGSIATTDATQNDRITALELMTGSYATTGSSNIVGNQTITGSVYITQNLTVLGTSSFLYLTASQLAVSSAFISVNVFEPMERFGGIKVYDSGSSNATASLAWDSQNNKWVYQNASGGSYSGGMLMMGPRNTGSLGEEVGTIANVIMKGMGGDHISGSNISDDGSNVRINSNTTITGSLNVSSTISSTNITAIETATSSLNSFTSSASGRLSAIETSTGSLNTFSSSTNTRLSSIETSTGSLNSYTSSNNTRLNAIESTTGSLNSYTSSTNTRLSSIETSTGSLNTFTSSASSRLGSLETASGSIRSDFNSYTSSANGRLSAIETSTGSLNTFTSSVSGRLSSIETSTGSLNTFTSSAGGRLSAIETSTGSLNTYTSSNTTNINAIHTATGSLNSYTSSQNTINSALNTATSSLNSFTNSFNSAISLSGADVTVKGNFTVSGTTTTVNSTTVSIGDNIISLNGSGATNAGIVVRDATSPTTTSGSLLWDTTNDKWIAGPLGAEDDVVLRTTSQTLTNKTISGASNTLSNIGNGSLTNSSITIAGTSTSLGGTISAATIGNAIGAFSGSAQVTGLANSQLTNSSITIAGTSTSLGGSISAATIGNAIGAFSGSAQVALTGTTGFGTYLNQAVLTTSNPTFNSVIAADHRSTGTGYITYDTDNAGTNSLIIRKYGTTVATFNSSGNSVFAGTISASNFSGTSSGTNTGDQTTITGAAGSVTTPTYNDGTTFVSRFDAQTDGTSKTYTIYNSTSGDQPLSTGLYNVLMTKWSGAYGSMIAIDTEPGKGNLYLRQKYSSTWGTWRTVLDSSNYTTYTVPTTGATSITTLGTIATGTWNGTAIANAYLANSSFYVGTTSISLGRASASQTLTGVNIDGSAGSVAWTNVSGRPTAVSSFTNDSGYQTSSGTVTNSYYMYLNGGQSGAVTINEGRTGVYRTESGSGGTFSYAPVLHVGGGDTMWQIQGSYGSSGTGNIQWRQGYQGSFGGWCTILHSSNYGGYSTFSGNVTVPLNSSSGFQNANSSAWFRPTDTSGNTHIYNNNSGGIYLDTNANHYFRNTAGTNRLVIDTSGNATLSGVFTENSSIRYKKDVETITNGLDKVLQMRGVTYVKKDNGVKEIGVIAEEMNEVEPLVVIKNQEGVVDSVSYGRINAILIEAVKEMDEKMKAQDLIISELKRKLGL